VLGYRRCEPTMKPATMKHRKPRPKGGPRTFGRLQRALDDAARREIEASLRETGGNVTHAARALGISQPALLRRINALGLVADRYRR
jgi:DNA-binding NtrC family response regulator